MVIDMATMVSQIKVINGLSSWAQKVSGNVLEIILVMPLFQIKQIF